MSENYDKLKAQFDGIESKEKDRLNQHYADMLKEKNGLISDLECDIDFWKERAEKAEEKLTNEKTLYKSLIDHHKETVEELFVTQKELAQLRSMSTVEMMSENYNVRCHVAERHCKARHRNSEDIKSDNLTREEREG